MSYTVATLDAAYGSIQQPAHNCTTNLPFTEPFLALQDAIRMWCHNSWHHNHTHWGKGSRASAALAIIGSGLHSMPCSTDNPCRGALVVETTVRACTCSYPGTHSQLKMGVHLPRNSADANQSNESCKLTRSKSRVWLSFDWFAPAHSAVNVAWAGNTANKIKKNFVSSTNALTMNDKILQYTAVHHTTVGKRYKAI